MNKDRLYRKNANGTIEVWFIETNDSMYSDQYASYRICTAKQLGENFDISEWITINGTSLSAKKILEFEIKTLYTSQEDQGFTRDKTILYESDAKFTPMFCSQYTPECLTGQVGLHIQPKLNGIRCIARKAGLWDILNRKITGGYEHIENELRPVFNRMPDLILDGELYSPPLPIKSPNKYTEYHIFDTPSIKGGYNVRFSALNSGLKGKEKLYPHIKLIQNSFFKFLYAGELEEKAKEAVASGYEGLIIRLNNIEYEQGKISKSLIKFELTK